MSSTPVEVHRDGEHSFVATNDRGATVAVGRDGAPDSFTPGELLLAAIAACSAVTSENLVTRRLGESASLVAHADREKTEEDPHKFSSIQVAVDFDEITDPDERAKLVDSVERAIERLCTVSRTVQEGTPISLRLPGQQPSF